MSRSSDVKLNMQFLKEGNRSETRTEVDTVEMLAMYASHSVFLLFELDKGNRLLLMKRFCHDDEATTVTTHLLTQHKHTHFM